MKVLVFEFIDIVALVRLCGNCFLIFACGGLVIGTFELAFKRIYDQVLFRMFIHFVCVPVGVYISSLEVKPVAAKDVSENVLQISLHMFFLCLIIVGTFGINIAVFELGTILWTPELLTRMFIYSICLTFGIYNIPLHIK